MLQGCVAGLCCDPASRRLVATPRRSQPSQLPCSAELATHHASTHSLHPNPLVCPDRSILTPQLTSAHIHAAISASQPSCTCLATPPACAMPIHYAAHSLHVIARDKRAAPFLTTSASPYTPAAAHPNHQSASPYTPSRITAHPNHQCIPLHARPQLTLTTRDVLDRTAC